jgi:hypothetical protein
MALRTARTPNGVKKRGLGWPDSFQICLYLIVFSNSF